VWENNLINIFIESTILAVGSKCTTAAPSRNRSFASTSWEVHYEHQSPKFPASQISFSNTTFHD